jgi:hypothetical protein
VLHHSILTGQGINTALAEMLAVCLDGLFVLEHGTCFLIPVPSGYGRNVLELNDEIRLSHSRVVHLFGNASAIFDPYYLSEAPRLSPPSSPFATMHNAHHQ